MPALNSSRMNPFLLNNYVGPEYFCDRERETDILLKNIKNRSSTSVFAQRRIGKTALVKHVFHRLKEEGELIVLYLDIFATSTLKEFSDVLSTSIYNAFPIQKSLGRKFWEHIKLLRPVVRVNALSGEPELSLDVSRPEQIEKSVPQLFAFLEQQNRRVVIAIDEFQQILLYPEKNVEALLRTVIQELNNVSFVFLGSDGKLMMEIFNNAKRPFYASTKYLTLDKIPVESYTGFIESMFAGNSISIDRDVVALILNFTQRHTFYTQQLCHEIFANNDAHISEQNVVQALYRLLQQNEPVYFQYRNLLTKSQWKVLKAIAVGEEVTKPYAQEFMRKHALGSSSNVKRSLDALVEKSIVYHNLSVKQPFYEVQDKFLMRWLQNN